MSKRAVYHVTHRDEGQKDWAVKLVGADRASKLFENKQKAIDYAREHAKQEVLSQVVIHGQDNLIQKELTFGKDPEKYPG